MELEVVSEAAEVDSPMSTAELQELPGQEGMLELPRKPMDSRRRRIRPQTDGPAKSSSPMLRKRPTMEDGRRPPMLPAL